jgi:hypothetical protein
VGDFNGDGLLDVVITSTTPNDESNSTDYMDVWVGRGDGTFAVRNSYDLGGEPMFRPTVVVDLNGDGRDDVMLEGSYRSLDVWLGQADGTLRLAQHLSNAAGYPYDSVTELNGDGIPDLVVANSIYLGNGDGTLRFTGTYASGGINPGCPMFADFDRDGRPDMAVFNGGDPDSGGAAVGRSLAVLLGNGDGSFQTPQVLIVGPDADLRAVADVNADGFPDVVIGYSGSDVFVLINAADWPAHPPAITVGDVTVTEGNTGTRAAAFRVNLDVPSGQTITVTYSTADGTATAGSDYQIGSGTLTFAPGQTTRTITVPVIGDRLGEPNETFVVNLSSPTNATVADGQGVGTVLDDEPRVSISDVTKGEGKKGKTTLFVFTVTLSAAYDQPVTMSFRTVNGTATTNDGDYVARTGTITFAPGETTKTITIEVKGDSKEEAGEFFYLDLFDNSSNSLFTKNRGTGTILNDD